MHLRKSLFISLALVLVVVAASVIYAAATGTTTFLDSSDQPEYMASGTGLVADYSGECNVPTGEGTQAVQQDCGCDLVSMMMTDATGMITDIDTFCIDLSTGEGYDQTSWCSYENGCDPTLGPITYSLFDTAAGSVCDNNVGDENSAECGAYLLSGAATCLDEDYYQPGSLPAGSAYPVCGSIATASCRVPMPVGSRVYSVPAGAPTFYQPSLDAQTNFNLPAGTWYISEFSGDFAKVWIACQADMVWIPANAVSR